MELTDTALLGVLVLVGSSLPLVPTGELLSAAAALAAGSPPALLAVYAVCVGASLLGDSALFLGARAATRHLRPGPRAWLTRRRVYPAVRAARAGISGHAGEAVVTGRLVPGGRAPVILALATTTHPMRRFLSADLLACTLCAGLYVALGALGGHIADDPAVGTVLAVTAAVVTGVLLRLLDRARSRSRGPRRGR